ncbi:MAG: hypothetical protein INQ03_01290 [Candidatus Heimdallarchaeota archaeon]|nr:hypothetical protein [Candidatus Heimdallarchaeota archaeon]
MTEVSLALVGTHLIPYILIPLIAFGIYRKKSHLSKLFHSFWLVEIAFLLLMLSMVFEVLWHHFVQNWNYQNEFHILNGLMYVFMVAGFDLMAIGFHKNKPVDLILWVLIPITPVAYFLEWKEVIWTIQLVGLLIVTWRSWLVLNDKRVFLFPIFSFVVNMIFIALLFSTGDPIYHILHDVLGTLLGFAIFGYLIIFNDKRQKSVGLI